MGGKPWSHDETQALLNNVGKSLRSIRRVTGRKLKHADTISYYTRRHCGRNLTELVEKQGMALPKIAAMLGVSRLTVARWVQRGDLKGHVLYVGKQQRTIVKEVELIAFIQRGALVQKGMTASATWPPRNQWGDLAREAERTWRADWMATADICAMLCLVEKVPPTFPAPDVRGTSDKHPRWWRKTTVREWLREHPMYHHIKAVQEFMR